MSTDTAYYFVMMSLLMVVVYSKLLRTSCDYQLSTISWLGV